MNGDVAYGSPWEGQILAERNTRTAPVTYAATAAVALAPGDDVACAAFPQNT